MANQNAGGHVRFENDGIILIGADEVKNLVPGSLRIKRMQRERIPNKDRGTLGAVTVGDQRAQEIEFRVYRTANTEAMLALLFPAASSGYEAFFTTTIKVPNYQGATAGKSSVFNQCYLPEGIEEQMSGEGASIDEITIRIRHQGDIVTPATYP